MKWFESTNDKKKIIFFIFYFYGITFFIEWFLVFVLLGHFREAGEEIATRIW